MLIARWVNDPDVTQPSCIQPLAGRYVETSPGSNRYRWEDEPS